MIYQQEASEEMGTSVGEFTASFGVFFSLSLFLLPYFMEQRGAWA
jgi:hypothetical protein